MNREPTASKRKGRFLGFAISVGTVAVLLCVTIAAYAANEGAGASASAQATSAAASAQASTSTTAASSTSASTGGVCPASGASMASTSASASASDSTADGEAEESGLSDDEKAAWAAYGTVEAQDSGTCLTCHTDADALTAAASGDVADPTMYQVSAAYPDSLHGSLGCTYCHGGDSTAATAEDAHADMNPRPTADGGLTVCGTCHEDIAQRSATSLHYTTAGIECTWKERLSKSGDGTLGEQYYHTDACRDCHADCGQCHVRKAATRQFGVEDNGFISQHMFVDATQNSDITATCLSCHAGAITACYTTSDVHGTTGANFNCMDCHSETDVHGDGVERTTMIDSGAVSTECIECHPTDTLSATVHTSTHLTDVACQACHTTEYNTCTSCHGWDAANRGDEPFTMANECYLGYDTNTGKITTLVRAPISDGMLGDVGVTLNAEDLNTRSSFFPAFSHSVVKPTADQAFCDRCHGEGTALVTTEDLQYPDFETDVLVDPLPEVTAPTE